MLCWLTWRAGTQSLRGKRYRAGPDFANKVDQDPQDEIDKADLYERLKESNNRPINVIKNGDPRRFVTDYHNALVLVMQVSGADPSSCDRH